MDEAGEDVCGSAMCHYTKARGLHMVGDHAEAERLLRVELNEVLAASDWDEERLYALALLAKVLDAQGRHDEAGVTMDEGRALLQHFPAGTPTERFENRLAV